MVIDLNFPGQMNDTEMRSMVSQLMYSYGANKRAAQPCQLYFTSLQVTLDPVPFRVNANSLHCCITLNSEKPKL